MFGLFALSAFKFSMLALIATVIASVFAFINDKSKRVKWLVGAYVLLYIITYVMNYIFMFTNSMLTITTINSIVSCSRRHRRSILNILRKQYS